MKHLLLLLLVAVAYAKVYYRCEWARTLKTYGMDGYRGVSLADWVCLTEHSSGFNTNATTPAKRSSTDYGIFQINSAAWCDDGQTQTINGCGISCSDLMADVGDSICCAKRIVRGPQGLEAWYKWISNCKGRDLNGTLTGCDV
ncbi:lysozyme C-like [Fundulus heteroclitus]|uniref:lysozyme C-like n=1 Tax=Fundulus heteroclitus TaxID=8078 RepID=UPI00165BD62A|nr:lysozyme C-like [Fundulus heteroclitus]XP_035995879.1 lysozyme C-like [Fundulus heteroclitus]XP_035995880.1 lysozyme C-like [Fundulus heteroclitus]